ncbi:DUF2975 domain-containing protein [Virgibacillus sp. NKC19-3]|uniref:DUF2975 domain-containing protein n=1 Tax=Virgibacillus saliphilus TaxID=2831674 RepID=UPI001C9B13F5|nr:DUF2975 domain-containing protein [Virgibacillus sp. NKC19-3]MBY7144950.1 DUF2975 domain-containing protein [Virgibacillus sp. NKC19-3]
MKSNIIFKITSILCLVLFYLVLLTGVVTIIEYASRIWMPGSGLARSFGTYEPIFGYMDLHFYQQPDLYADKSFIFLDFISYAGLFLFALLFLWFMYKLLKNIYGNSIFMYENVSILFKLGITFLVLGAATTFMDGLLLSKAITALDISNASIAFSNIAYVDFIIVGIVLLIISSAMKMAVNAVEENEKTI